MKTEFFIYRTNKTAINKKKSFRRVRNVFNDWLIRTSTVRSETFSFLAISLYFIPFIRLNTKTSF